MDYNVYIGIGNENPTYQFTDDFDSGKAASWAAEKIALEEAKEFIGTRGIKRLEQIELENLDKFKGLPDHIFRSCITDVYSYYLTQVIQYQVKPTSEDTVEDLVRIDYGTSC